MRRARSLVALAALAGAGHAAAIELALRHSDGEFVDRGTISAEVTASGTARLDCRAGAAVTRSGNDIAITVPAASASTGADECNAVTANLGTLAAGTYRVRALLLAPQSTETAARDLVVLPLEGRCNAEPALQPALLVTPTVSGTALAQRVATDPVFADALGNPVVKPGPSVDDNHLAYLTYPPLVDPTVMSVRLHALADFRAVYRNGYFCFAPPPADQVSLFIEFHHAALDEYFYTADPNEILAIDRGDVGAWSRTGSTFHAVTMRGCPTSADTVVYRFAGRPGVGSHFFTRDRAECASVDRSARWDFEGIPFYAAAVQADGTCDAAHLPLYRMWRPVGASNHRFTTEASIVSAMTARGWIAEGVAMCVRKPV